MSSANLPLWHRCAINVYCICNLMSTPKLPVCSKRTIRSMSPMKVIKAVEPCYVKRIYGLQ